MNPAIPDADPAAVDHPGAAVTPAIDTVSPRSIVLITQSTAMGGMETHVQYLACDLASRGIRVGVVFPPGPDFDPPAARCVEGGADVLRAITDARSGRRMQLRGLRDFRAWLRKRRPDVVHLHTGGATGGFAAAAVARFTSSAKVVRTEHDVPAETLPRSVRLSSWGTDFVCRTVVAVSRRNAALREQRLRAPRRPAVVLNGVPVPPAPAEGDSNEMRSRLGIPSEAVVIGSVVRLAKGKGLDDLLHAFSLMPVEPPTRLLLVGDGPLRSELEALAQALGISSRVHFSGYQLSPEPFYQAMDIFCLAVPAGSMSIALLEAMARALPPVITFGGPEEAVIDGQTGFTSPPHDPAQLARTLTRLQADPALRLKLGQAAREHIITQLSSHRVAEDLLAVYRR